ncbi:glycosyltransferase family 8 protein [Parabacteroides sp.]|uniref:glycosyltransferase family 8 protein n=1 Tax=Parabacteroides sp. TaxID=1869337 RepID=UPI002579C533|nr:glycosyltransferase family 8 protein [Parabacteroides sp.]
MDIVCCPDKNYVMPTGIMMCSLCENNKEEEVTFHVMHTDLTAEHERSLKNITERYEKKSICFYKISQNDLLNVKLGEKGQQKLSISTYYRLLMSSLLPENVRRVIYLDGDIVVCGNLKGLWNEDMECFALAGVPDAKLHQGKIEQTYNQLKYSPSLGYFNAGVLLVNLDYWRKHNSIKEIFDFVKSTKNGFLHHDQDILNYVFREKKKFLPLKYNLMPEFLLWPPYRLISWEYDEEIDQEAARSPVIIHYSIAKPWIKGYDHPYREEFLKYKSLTEWKDLPLKANIKVRIKRVIKRILVHFKVLDKGRIPQWQYTYGDLQIKDNN